MTAKNQNQSIAIFTQPLAIALSENIKIMTSIYKTFFYDIDGSLLGSANDILPIPLRIGMQITIHGCEGNNWGQGIIGVRVNLNA